MIHDYKNLTGSLRARSFRKHWHLHGVALFMLSAILAISISLFKTSSEASIPIQINEMVSLPLQLPAIAHKVQNQPSPQYLNEQEWQKFTVKSGQNLAAICARAGVKASEVHALMGLGKEVNPLNILYPNDQIAMQITTDGHLAALRYDIHQSKQLIVIREGEDENGVPIFKAETVVHPLEVRTKHASGLIEYSLYQASHKAGLSNQLFMELATIFGWDIDFTQDVRKGDYFTVIYEEYYRDGDRVESTHQKHPIIAAEFVNQGQSYRAIRYMDSSGKTDYFTPDGSSLRKAFMRNPIEFSRISSYFNPNRRHPILNKIRAHNGVDYAAKTGTPIHATGEGKVIFRGSKGGYGNTIIIQHGQRYSTLYAHMSRFASNAQVGRKVKQNDVIGYVGRSGLATGPHLHYEFRVDNAHRNPLTIRHPSVDPISDASREDFMQQAQILLSQLNTIDRHFLALNETAE